MTGTNSTLTSKDVVPVDLNRMEEFIASELDYEAYQRVKPMLTELRAWRLGCTGKHGSQSPCAEATPSETGPVYRKWPGEPPHCMSCDCGMTDEQKRTVPFEDYQTFHTALMAIVYESKSFTEAVKLASDALQHKPPSEKANEPPRCEKCQGWHHPLTSCSSSNGNPQA